MPYEFGPKLQGRLDRMGGGLGDAIQMALGAYNLPDTMGKDDIFGMSDLRGLLRFGGEMGIDPLTMALLGRVLPNFNNEAWRPNKQTMPGVFQQWMASRDPNYKPPAPEAPAPADPGVQTPRPRPQPGYRGENVRPDARRASGGSGGVNPYQAAPVPAPPGGNQVPDTGLAGPWLSPPSYLPPQPLPMPTYPVPSGGWGGLGNKQQQPPRGRQAVMGSRMPSSRQAPGPTITGWP